MAEQSCQRSDQAQRERYYRLSQPSRKPGDANERQPNSGRAVDPPEIVREHFILAIGTNLLLLLGHRHDSVRGSGKILL